MIQRIQTVYLLIAMALTGSLFFVNMAQLANETGLFFLNFKGVFSQGAEILLVVPALALTLLLAVTMLVLVAIIFLYKKRILQIRLCGMSLGLLLGLSGMIYYFGKTASKELGAELAFSWTLVVPIIALFFVFLALKAIARDEALVRSLDRIR